MVRVFVLTLVMTAPALSGSSATTTTRSLSAQEARFSSATAPNGGMVPPKVTYYESPKYTPAAIKNGIEGVVTVQAEFDIDGNFRVLRILNGLRYGLDETALAALSGWRFVPAYRSGRRVSVI